MSVGKRDYLSRLQTLLVFLILDGMAKMKLAVLPFLCCGEILKNSIHLVTWFELVSLLAHLCDVVTDCCGDAS